MSAAKKWTKGQPVVVVMQWRGEVHHCHVQSAGPKWVCAHDERFTHDGRHGGVYQHRLYTEIEWAAIQEHDRAVRGLRAYGVILDRDCRLSPVAVLRALDAIPKEGLVSP